MSSFIPDGYCGLYCGACPRYLATKADKTEELGIEKCQGCKSDVVTVSWCKTCNLKKCAREKGVEFCYECSQYPCRDIENFKNEKDWPYHIEIYDYMSIIKKEGKENWLIRMKERWSCPSCKTETSWWDLNCNNCGIKINGYKKP